LSKLLDDLRNEVAKGRVLAIVGAGVSIGATKGETVASWTGLLKSGLERCAEVTQPLPIRWEGSVREKLESGDLGDLLSAAEMVSSRLGAPTGGEYRRWLRETVGQLKVEDRSVIEALHELGIPLATTNYDGLLEKVTGRPPVTWREKAKVERVIRGDDPGILHLHGYWDEPESVVLGITSYEEVLRDAHAQTIQQALRATCSLLLVGYGEGLADPNFSALLHWSRSVFSDSEYRHFRLCLDSEVAIVQAKHPPEERIFACAYGPDHDDLAPFLQSLSLPQHSSEEESPASRIPSIPIAGLAMAGVFALLAILWFERHAYPYAKMLLTGEGTLFASLAAALAITYGVFKGKIYEQAQKFWSLLDKPIAPKMLGGGILLMIFLLFTTSSIYIVLDSVNPGTNFELNVKKNGTPDERVTLSSNHPYFYRLLFFSRPGLTSIIPLKPAGYASAKQQLKLGGTIRFHIPIDFKRKDLHILRLVPGWGIIESLPQAKDSAAFSTKAEKNGHTVAGCDCATKTEEDQATYPSYQLRIRFPNKNCYCIRWYLQTIYVGASAADLEWAATDSSNKNWLRLLEDKIVSPTSPERSALQLAASSPFYLPTTELAAGDKVEIDLIFVDGLSSETHHLGSYIVSHVDLMQTILLKDLK
jgi:hypothetical protein